MVILCPRGQKLLMIQLFQKLQWLRNLRVIIASAQVARIKEESNSLVEFQDNQYHHKFKNTYTVVLTKRCRDVLLVILYCIVFLQ